MFEDFDAFVQTLRKHIGQMFLTEKCIVTMNESGVIIMIPGNFKDLTTEEANDLMLKYLSAREN